VVISVSVLTIGLGAVLGAVICIVLGADLGTYSGNDLDTT